MFYLTSIQSAESGEVYNYTHVCVCVCVCVCVGRYKKSFMNAMVKLGYIIFCLIFLILK